MDFSNEIKYVIELVEKQQKQDASILVVSEVSYNEGEAIVYRHQLDKDMYYIASGEARVRLPGQKSREIRISSGEVLGELSFLMGEERSATVEAIKPTICKRLHSESLRDWLEANPTVAIRFYRSLSETIAKRLRNTDSKSQGKADGGSELNALLQNRFLSFCSDMQNLCTKTKADIDDVSSKYKEMIRKNEEKFQSKREELTPELQKQGRMKLENLRQEINIQSAEERTAILKKIQPDLQDIFDQIEQVLFGVEDLYERQHVGALARNVFSSILSGSKLFQLIEKSKGIETVELITHITRYSHMTIRERAINEINALLEEVIGGWDTFEAYRSRFDMLNQCFDSEPLSLSKQVCIFNDLTGTLFSRIYPMIARRRGEIYVYSDISETFSYSEFALDMRSDTVQYKFEYIPQFESILGKEYQIKATDCDVIVVHGLLDYLPDDISYRLFQKLSGSLKKGGCILATGLASTNDEILVSDFLGVRTIRRQKSDFLSLCDNNIFSNVTYTEKSGGILLRIEK